MEPRYDIKEVESRIYTMWENSGYFNPDKLPEAAAANDSDGKRTDHFTIIMPPPNANGSLHAGHALFVTLQDIMTRYERMKGKKALWLPGADHAGFETQVVYERELEKQGRSRFGMDRKQLYDEIYAFTIANKSHMENQVRALGASCDWSREKFTLDPDIVLEAQKTFVTMYNDGLVYRGKRIVNWCTKHQTSLSDVETEFKERKDPFYYFQYGPFVIGTARPETKFGDKYVVMHPDDERYKQYKHGETFELEWINGPITATVIKDKSIDMSFGTGVMTITPWHDLVDFEIAERHGLEKEQVIDFQGKLLPIAGEFAGMKIDEARPKIAEKLKSKGLLVNVDDEYAHSVRVCYKCERTIEPQIMDQWFVKMATLAKSAADAVRAGKIKFIPERFEKIFLYWMDNSIDWNISRQIVWGIRIPAWFCTCGGITASIAAPEACSVCGAQNDGHNIVQDPDVFDTWFSSGQWPLLTLGWPDGKDLEAYYPTQVMESGYDLIFKWIPRMVIFGLYLKNEIPFETVYLHGLVNDAQGKKMSKSKGNVVNPIELTEKYGADALRIGLVVGNPAGADLALSEDKIRGYRNFSTKIWNAARFVFMNKPAKSASETDPAVATEEFKNRDEIKEFAALKTEVTKHLDSFEFHLAAEKIYHYVWHTFADKIIEAEKKKLREGSDAEKAASYALLEYILLESLTLLHPFMPFITEEIYRIFRPEEMLMVKEW